MAQDAIRREKDEAEAELIASYEDELTWRLEELREWDSYRPPYNPFRLR